MRGETDLQLEMYSYIELEKRVPDDHPIRKTRRVLDKALKASRLHCQRWSALYSTRAITEGTVFLDYLFIRSERQLVERKKQDRCKLNQ